MKIRVTQIDFPRHIIVGGVVSIVNGLLMHSWIIGSLAFLGYFIGGCIYDIIKAHFERKSWTK